MILWVDDDLQITLKPFMDEVREDGYELFMVQNPDEMWKILETRRTEIDAIIMDIMLPTGNTVDSAEARMGVITGLLILKKLKQNDDYSSIPVIIFTILSDQEVMEWAKKNNITYLQKQVTSPLELLSQVNKLNINKDNSF